MEKEININLKMKMNVFLRGNAAENKEVGLHRQNDGKRNILHLNNGKNRATLGISCKKLHF